MSNAVAFPGNPWSQIAGELDKVLGAPILKFTKNGTYALSDTDEVSTGTRCIARVDLVQTGWVKWVDGAVAQRLMGPVAERYVPVPRRELGDDDETLWEVQPDGSRRDPWQFQMVLPVTRLDTEETFNFTVGSKGGLNAINKLIRTYGNRLAKDQSGLPIVELKADFYKHRTYGKIYFPALIIINWTDSDDKPMSVERDLEDAIPF